MRIGLFTNNYRPLVNGLATSVETFARAFRRAGHEVTVVAPCYPGASDREPGVLRVPGVRAPTHHAYVLPIPRWPGTSRRVGELGLDVYHAQHPLLLGAAAARWARRAGRPLVFSYHTRYERYAHYVPGPARLVGELAVRQALAFAGRAELVIAPAPAVARDLRARGLCTRLEVVPTGVPLPAAYGEEVRRAWRARLALGFEGPLCLSVGRLAPEKNLAFLLAALARLRRTLPAVRLLLVGDGDDRARLERLAQKIGLAEAVRFVGAVAHDAVGGYYLAADLFLFPSTSETQGLVALEALAAGLPVVAVRSEAATDLLTDGETGILTAEDPAAFARAAAELWRQPETRRAMAAAGRRVAAGYDPDRAAARLLALYRELLDARARQPSPREAGSPEARRP